MRYEKREIMGSDEMDEKRYRKKFPLHGFNIAVGHDLLIMHGGKYGKLSDEKDFNY